MGLGDLVHGSGEGGYGGHAVPTVANVPDIKSRIKMAVLQAEERLKAVKRAQEIFEKNPDLEELLNIMQRAHF